MAARSLRPHLLVVMVTLAAMASMASTSDDVGYSVSDYPPDQPGANVSFWCAWRSFALEYGKHLQPSSSELLFDALQLGPLCNQTRDKAINTAAANAPASRTFSRAPAEAAARIAAVAEERFSKATAAASSTIWVDDAQGSDSNPGTKDKPKKTVQAGITATRGLPRPAAVVVKAGTYFLSDTLVLGPEDSHLTLTSAGDGQVWISGAAPLGNLDWKPYNVTKQHFQVFPNTNDAHGCAKDDPTDPTCGCSTTPSAEDCQDLCGNESTCGSFTWHDHKQGGWALQCCRRRDGEWSPYQQTGHTSGLKHAGSRVFVAAVPSQLASSLKQLRHNGVRAPRARHPNANPETDLFPKGWNPGAAEWLPAKKPADPLFVLVNNSAIAKRGSTDFQEYSGGIGGPCAVFDPPFSYWCSAHPSGGGGFQYYTPSGMKLNPGSLPDVPFAHNSVKNPPVAHVWRRSHWSSWMFEVDYQPDHATVQFLKGGFQGCRGGPGSDWYVENALELLDTAGEWFFDDHTNNLYFAINGTDTSVTNLDGVHLQTLLMANGTQKAPIVNLSITNIGFRDAAPTYLEPHGVPSGGDWGLERRSAVFFEGTEDLIVRNSEFVRLDGNGLMLSGYNRRAALADNEFAWTGGSAMVAWGRTDELSKNGTLGWDGTGGDFPWHTSVVQNLVRETGVWEKQSSCWFQAKTAQTTLLGNLCFNLARAGFNFNDGFGGGDEVHNNLIFNSCRESADHGPINSWDRQPYVTLVADGTPSAVMLPRNISRNFLGANYGGSNGAVDNDDGSLHYNNNHNFQVYGHQKFKVGGIRSFGNVMAYVSDFGSHWSAPGALPLVPNAMFNNTVVFSPSGSGDYHNCLPWKANHNRVFGANVKVEGSACKKTMTVPEWQALDPSSHDVGSTWDPKIPSDEQIVAWGRELLY